MSLNQGLEALEARVLKKGLCVGCGACAGLCPYLLAWRDGVIKLHDCDLIKGRCFAYCPRGEVDLASVHRAVFGGEYQDIELGPLKRIVAARALDEDLRARAQSGGVVSALMSLALREGLIQAAVLTARRDDLLPQGRVVRRPDEVASMAGSSYVTGPTLAALNQGPWAKGERIGLVGLPCQVLSLGQMRAAGPDKQAPVEQVTLIIGLFCTWALAHQPFFDFLHRRLNHAAIRKLDITPPPQRLLQVFTDAGQTDIPLDEIRSFIRPGCAVCLDMTAELADVSVGTLEGRAGWNTVVIRTRAGEELLKRAEVMGVLEVEALPSENLNHLKEASILKKKRALAALDPQEGYPRLPESITACLESWPQEVEP